MPKGKNIFISGATGSLGQALIEYLLDKSPRKIIAFSRSEHPQVEMSRKWPSHKFPIRYHLGDVRDRYRLRQSLKNVDWIIHAAAVKHVDWCQYNPKEALTINVTGTMNIVEIAIECQVEKCLIISTDKAVNPVNLYGACKLVSDQFALAASVYDPKGTKFGVIRFGNFWDSRGSVIPHFRELVNSGSTELPITDKRCTRFFIKLEDAAILSIKALQEMQGGEIFNPKMQSFCVSELAKQIFPNQELKEIGMRPGERIHEPLLTGYESKVYETDSWYVVSPSIYDGKPLESGFKYTSTG